MPCLFLKFYNDVPTRCFRVSTGGIGFMQIGDVGLAGTMRKWQSPFAPRIVAWLAQVTSSLGTVQKKFQKPDWSSHAENL